MGPLDRKTLGVDSNALDSIVKGSEREISLLVEEAAFDFGSMVVANNIDRGGALLGHQRRVTVHAVPLCANNVPSVIVRVSHQVHAVVVGNCLARLVERAK